jgi:hypothetical protein
MGILKTLLALLGRGTLRDTIEVFVPNQEAQAQRDAMARTEALCQFTTEFRQPGKGRFDRFMDALNRFPRPMMVFGTLGLFVSAMVDPLWFAARMDGLHHVPEPLWWLLGAIVSFYFGARHQFKGQEFKRKMTVSMQEKPPNGPEQKAVNNSAMQDWFEGR